MKLKLQKTNLTLVQVYAPNLEADYAAFLDEVDDALQRVADTESVLIMGDFNAHVGSDSQTWSGVIGRNGDPDLNANGVKLLDFCCGNGMSIMNTYFQHRDIHKYTWYRDTVGQKSMIDFFIASSGLRERILDVCVKRGAELSTDHHLVVCRLRLADSVPLRRREGTRNLYRIRWESLEDESIRGKLANDMHCRFQQIPEGCLGAQQEWELFKSALLAAAIGCCGRKRLGVPSGNEKKTCWWTPEVRGAVRAKKEAFKSWLNSKTVHMRALYSEARKTAASAVKAAKAKCWEMFGMKLESNYGTANKVFWQTIRRLRGKKSSAIQRVKSKEGELLTNEDDVLQRWREHFNDLLNPVTAPDDDGPPITIGTATSLSVEEVTEAIKSLRDGKAAGLDEIRPEMLKALGPSGSIWLTRVIRVAWDSGEAPLDWQTAVVIPIFKKGDQRDCTNYRGISLLSLPGKVYAKVLERKCRDIVDSKIQDEQCGFRTGRSTRDQIFTLKQVFEKAWEYNVKVYSCFVDLEKAYDRVPRGRLWGVLQEYGIDGQLLWAIKSLYENCSCCVRINGAKSNPFTVSIGLRQGCVLSPLLFIIYMDWIARRSQGKECVRLGEREFRHLLFADDLVLLTSSETDLQNALERFATVCEQAGMKINVAKTECMILSRNLEQCSVHVNGAPLNQVEKFKYLGAVFTRDGKGDTEIDNRIGQAGAILRQLYRSIVKKTELSRKAKLAVFKSVIVPTLTYGHESWVMTEKTRSRVQAAEMRCLRSIAGVSRLDKIRSSAVRESLEVESLLLQIERSQMRWYGQVIRMPQERLVVQSLLAQPTGRRPRSRPKARWIDKIQDLGYRRLGIPPEELAPVAKDPDLWKKLLALLSPLPERSKAA
jgi:hypothetical protein